MVKKKLTEAQLREAILTAKEDNLGKTVLLNEYGEQLYHLSENLNQDLPNIQKVVQFRSLLESAPQQLLDMTNESFFVCEHMIDNANALPSTKELFKRNYYLVRRSLEIDKAPGLIKLLLEQVATAWLRLQIVDHEYSRIMTQGQTIRELTYWDKRLAGAHSRFDKAVATVTNTIKKLGPNFNIQINVAQEGGQQVNIGNKE